MVPRTITSVVTPETMALNAFIYGYAGHSLVTPHGPLQQLWWSETRISQRVTIDFVSSKINPSLRNQLYQEISAFSDLTNSTYLDWITTRARRLFLILSEIGVPDKIFSVVDSSWDDDDLPIPAEMISQLGFRNGDSANLEIGDKAGRDKPADALIEEIEAKFLSTQFAFLLRELYKGEHIDYAENEIVPLEYVHKMPPAVSLQRWYRVRIASGDVFVRRKFTLNSGIDLEGRSFDLNDRTKEKEKRDESRSQFLHDINIIKRLNHPHVVPAFASYIFRNDAFILSPFNAQHTLQTFIDHRNPAQIQGLTKQARHQLLLGWLYCLASATATIHNLGIAHTSIRPSNIVVDSHNVIAFSDIPSLVTFSQECGGAEAYDYAAPEVVVARELIAARSRPSPSPVSSISFGNNSTLNTSNSKPGRFSSKRQFKSAPKSSNKPKNSVSLSTSLPSPSSSIRPSSIPSSHSLTDSIETLDRTPTPQLDCRDYNFSVPYSKPSDIFSLACIFLDILCLILKKRNSEFVKHRHSKIKTKNKSKSKVGNKTDLSLRLSGNGSESSTGAYPSVPTTPTTPLLGSFPVVLISSFDSSSGSSLCIDSRTLMGSPSPTLSAPYLKPKVDSSFHANMEHVYSWMDMLETTAVASTATLISDDYGGSNRLHNAVRIVLSVCRKMLQVDPNQRPTATEVRGTLASLQGIGYSKMGACCAVNSSTRFGEIFVPPSTLPSRTQKDKGSIQLSNTAKSKEGKIKEANISTTLLSPTTIDMVCGNSTIDQDECLTGVVNSPVVNVPIPSSHLSCTKPLSPHLATNGGYISSNLGNAWRILADKRNSQQQKQNVRNSNQWGGTGGGDSNLTKEPSENKYQGVVTATNTETGTVPPTSTTNVHDLPLNLELSPPTPLLPLVTPAVILPLSITTAITPIEETGKPNTNSKKNSGIDSVVSMNSIKTFPLDRRLWFFFEFGGGGKRKELSRTAVG